MELCFGWCDSGLVQQVGCGFCLPTWIDYSAQSWIVFTSDDIAIRYPVWFMCPIPDTHDLGLVLTELGEPDGLYDGRYLGSVLWRSALVVHGWSSSNGMGTYLRIHEGSMELRTWDKRRSPGRACLGIKDRDGLLTRGCASTDLGPNPVVAGLLA